MQLCVKWDKFCFRRNKQILIRSMLTEFLSTFTQYLCTVHLRHNSPLNPEVSTSTKALMHYSNELSKLHLISQSSFGRACNEMLIVGKNLKSLRGGEKEGRKH